MVDDNNKTFSRGKNGWHHLTQCVFATEPKPLGLWCAAAVLLSFSSKRFRSNNHSLWQQLWSWFTFSNCRFCELGFWWKGFVLRIVTLTCRELADLPFEVLKHLRRNFNNPKGNWTFWHFQRDLHKSPRPTHHQVQIISLYIRQKIVTKFCLVL